MDKEEIRTELNRDPFIPLQMRMTNGRKVEIPFRDVARMIFSGVLVFKGLKEGSHQVKGFDVFPYEDILDFEKRPNKKGLNKRAKPQIVTGPALDKELFRTELNREPFIPLRLRLWDGRNVDIPYRKVAHMVAGGILVFKGLKEGSSQAKGYDVLSYDRVRSVEQRPQTKRRKKAS